jgi:hypothetical protein
MSDYYSEAYRHWQEVERERARVRSKFTRRGFLRGARSSRWEASAPR